MSLTDSPSAKVSNTRGNYPTQYADIIDDAAVGVIEGESVTVSGGLIAACCESSVKCRSYCLQRTSKDDRLIAIVDSERCACCIRGDLDDSMKVNSLRFGNGSCFREIFRIPLSKADKLAGLLTELTRTAEGVKGGESMQVTVTAPFCTVSNITHLSHRVLGDLFTLDSDFLWGDNLIFSATA